MRRFVVKGRTIIIEAEGIEELSGEIREGMVIRGCAEPPVYLVQNSKKRWVRTVEVVNKILEDLNTVLVIIRPQQKVDDYPGGEDILKWPEEVN